MQDSLDYVILSSNVPYDGVEQRSSVTVIAMPVEELSHMTLECPRGYACHPFNLALRLAPEILWKKLRIKAVSFPIRTFGVWQCASK